MQITKIKDLLDAGCYGTGQTSYLLFNKMLNESQYIGLDVSDSVYVAKDIFKKKSSNFVQCSFWIYLNQYILIQLFLKVVFHHTIRLLNLYLNYQNILKKEGFFFSIFTMKIFRLIIYVII